MLPGRGCPSRALFGWCLRSESNQRHEDFQSSALPTELQRQMATRKGLEPSTSGVTGRRSNQLNYRAKLGGGNNRARTCDPMLVRHVLSQLSYAPGSLPLVGSANPQAAKLIISKTRHFVNSFFQIFFLFSRSCFFGGKGSAAPHREAASASNSSFSNTCTASQNWQVISARPCSWMSASSSSLPRLMRALRIRSRLQ